MQYQIDSQAIRLIGCSTLFDLVFAGSLSFPLDDQNLQNNSMDLNCSDYLENSLLLVPEADYI